MQSIPDATFSALSSFDDSRNLTAWIAATAERSPAHPLFVYASSDSEAHYVTWTQVWKAVGYVARLIDSYFDLAVHVQEATSPVIGILANLDSITYNVLTLSILRAGGTAFLISTRNSPAAVAHLLQITRTRRLLVSNDEPIRELVASTLEFLSNAGDVTFSVHAAPAFETLFGDNGDEYTLTGGFAVHADAPAIITHSSGSTNFPKPITLTHRAIIQRAYITDIVGVDMPKQRLAVHALPLYHGMCLSMTFWACRTGLTLTVFPPQIPPVVPSPATFLASARASDSTFMLCVPLFLETWSRDADDIAQLQKFRGIICGGGSFDHAVGEKLTQHDVPLIGLYGATEIGAGMLLVRREPGDREWEWLQLSSRTNATFLPQGDDTFELAYIECATHKPLVFNCTIDGKRAFATNDIVVRHPQDKMKFKIKGRKDDQIVLSSGEKTNPGPIEAIICRNPFVHAAVMFGRAREQNGIIIQPAQGSEFDPTDTDMLARFRNDIWSTVEEANAFAPSHSRLYKEMILVTHPSKPMEMTAKHTPRRAATLEAYNEDIEAAYAAVNISIQTDAAMPVHWDALEVLGYVRKIVHQVLRNGLGDDADIFEHGGNSLQATYIRNILVRAMREACDGAAKHVPQNFVYANPAIIKLANRVLAIVTTSGGDIACEDDISARALQIEELVAEHSARFFEHCPTQPLKPMEGEVVLLTGSTGGLGSQLLALLASSPDVSHVYALNRRAVYGDKSLRQRQVEAFSERGLDVGIVDSPKVTLVEGDTAVEDLTIDPVLFSEIRDSITLIIHNAWRVNFNLGLASFMPNIRGVRNLVNLALRSPMATPPRVIYASSVGLLRNLDVEHSRPLESRIDDPKSIIGSGYSESKFVGEKILENAANVTPLRPVMVRIGQMAGTASGAWNVGDWLPAIVRSGQVLGVLPQRNDCISWIPLEAAAQAIFEFRHSESQYLHLAHPNPALWSTVFEVFSSRLNVPLVSWNEWLTKLEQCDSSRAEKNPAVYLLDFFRKCPPVPLKNREAPGVPLMDLRQALQASPSLARTSLSQIGRDAAEMWLSHWRAVGFLHQST